MAPFRDFTRNRAITLATPSWISQHERDVGQRSADHRHAVAPGTIVEVGPRSSSIRAAAKAVPGTPRSTRSSILWSLPCRWQPHTDRAPTPAASSARVAASGAAVRRNHNPGGWHSGRRVLSRGDRCDAYRAAGSASVKHWNEVARWRGQRLMDDDNAAVGSSMPSAIDRRIVAPPCGWGPTRSDAFPSAQRCWCTSCSAGC
jgi:hypothetical protein